MLERPLTNNVDYIRIEVVMIIYFIVRNEIYRLSISTKILSLVNIEFKITIEI